MLKRITKIESFGILDNYKNDNALKEFKEFNIIYGWNGSGKTTLSKLFRCLETKNNHPDFATSKYIIETSEGKIDAANFEQSAIVKVFNNDFISENLNLFDAQTKPIIFISKEKVDEKKEYDEKKISLKKKSDDLKKIEDAKQSTIDAIDECHKDAGKAIKDFLLGTIYANVTYNKATSRKIWASILPKKIVLKDSILTKDELIKQKNYTLLNSRLDSIADTLQLSPIDIEKLTLIANEIKIALEAQVTSKVIDRLKENPAISEWVEKGLNLHKNNQTHTCEFCGEAIKASRIADLEQYYNDEYSNLMTSIQTIKERLGKGKRDTIQDVHHLLYPELQPAYQESLKELNIELKAINDQIDDWIALLDNKHANPFSIVSMPKINVGAFEQYNEKLGKINSIFISHNEISNSHTKLAEAAKGKIEFHFVSQFAIKDKLSEKENSIVVKDQEIGKVREEIQVLRIRLQFLENELKSDTIAIAEINEFLHKFLGRNNIVLERIEQGGYQLKRDGIVAKNLSEGEKTAISLIYFFSKIKENESDIKNLIIVLDDPISSFDSNHLFNASSFIRHATNGCHQLFILTHNFWFFKQVRDWMLKKNKKDAEVTNVYSIERGVLKTANTPLVKFNSEYQHVFHTVLNYQNLAPFDENACFTIANSVRRLLEGFTSFKTPDNGNFNGALQLAERRGLAPELRERIFYFVNKYSHLDRIESFDNTVETLAEEGYNVVADVLALIKNIDGDHYESMLKVCDYKEPKEKKN